MLLRSSSASILDSWIPHTKESSSPEPEMVPQIQRTRSINLSASSNLNSPSKEDLKISRALSENDLKELTIPAPKTRRKSADMGSIGIPSVPPSRRKSFDMSSIGLASVALEEIQEQQDVGIKESLDRLFTSSGLDVVGEGCVSGRKDKSLAQTLVGGGAIGNDGGRSCRGGGRGGGGGGDGRSANGDDEEEEFRSDLNHGNNEGVESYYEKMIEANPGNSLLLGNYAKFLKDVRGDIVKAEEYCGRAILVNPGDGSILALYADLIWQTHKDASRAQSYFDQAVQAAPDDCFVLASYAKFLWDSEGDEDEDEEEEEERQQQLVVEEHGRNTYHTLPTNFFHGSTPPIIASS